MCAEDITTILDLIFFDPILRHLAEVTGGRKVCTHLIIEKLLKALHIVFVVLSSVAEIAVNDVSTCRSPKRRYRGRSPEDLPAMVVSIMVVPC